MSCNNGSTAQELVDGSSAGRETAGRLRATEGRGMSTILVTGGTGHLGRDLVKQLTAQGRTVRVLARRPDRAPGVEWAQGDLATGEGLAAAVEGAQTIIHAATLSPIAPWQYPADRPVPQPLNGRRRGHASLAEGGRAGSGRALRPRLDRRARARVRVAVCACQAGRGRPRSPVGPPMVGRAGDALLLPGRADAGGFTVAAHLAAARCAIPTGRHAGRCRLPHRVP